MSANNSNRVVRSLQKLPENKRCFNCEVLGTNFIVPAFRIFVCTDCSGLHMKCGQRVKSISLGNYTPEEAKALQDGGNEKAARTYLAKWSPNTSFQKPIDKYGCVLFRPLCPDVFTRCRLYVACRKPPRVEEWIRTVFTSKTYFSEEAAREAEVHESREDKPLKQGSMLPLPAPTVPRGVPVPVPEPQPEPEPTLEPPALIPAPKVEEVSLLDFGNSPVKSASPADAWGAFDSAPAAGTAAQSTSAEPFDPFGTFGSDSMPSTSASVKAILDPFSAPAVPAAQLSTASFDPFGNADFPAAARTPAPVPTSVFDPFSITPGSSSGLTQNVVSTFNTASAANAGGGWSPFTDAPAAQAPASVKLNASTDSGFGLDVFNSMPPASETRPASHAGNSLEEFDAFPGQNSQSSQPAPCSAAKPQAATHAPSELPSDLFSDSTFSARSFPAPSGAQPFAMHMQPPGPHGPGSGMGGPLPGSGFGPGQPGLPGMGPGPMVAFQGQQGFGTQFGSRPAGGFGNPSMENAFGAPGQLGGMPVGAQFAAGMGAGGQLGGMAPGAQLGGMGVPGQLGGMGSPMPLGSIGTPGQLGGRGGPAQLGGLGGAGQFGAPTTPGSQFVGMGPNRTGPGGMGPSGMGPGGMGPAGQFSSVMGPPGFGGPPAAPMGFNAFNNQGMGTPGTMPGALGGAPGTAPFGAPNGFAGGLNAFGAAPPVPSPKKEDMAFADLVSDFKKALPSPAAAYSQQPGSFGTAGGFGYGNGPHVGAAGTPYGGAWGDGGFGGIPAQPQAAGPGFGTILGNPFA